LKRARWVSPPWAVDVEKAPLGQSRVEKVCDATTQPGILREDSMADIFQSIDGLDADALQKVIDRLEFRGT